MSSRPVSCRYGVNWCVASLKACSTTAAGADNAAVARFTEAGAASGAVTAGATGRAVVLRAPRRALR